MIEKCFSSIKHKYIKLCVIMETGWEVYFCLCAEYCVTMETGWELHFCLCVEQCVTM